MMPADDRVASSPAGPALSLLLDRLTPVPTEQLPAAAAVGRVLAEPAWADRDSPPWTVSAMDGYACRLQDIVSGRIHVAGEARAGQPPGQLPPGRAIRIFTGACVPAGTEAVIRREDVDENSTPIVIPNPESVVVGQSLRSKGENLRGGQEVLPAGSMVHAAAAAAMAAFGVCRLRVFRRVRLGLLVTGDELLEAEDQPEPWQIRDSNGPALRAMFGVLPYVELMESRRAVDDLSEITRALSALMSTCDVVFITGGVSRGDHDYVPGAVESAGARILFHRLAIRPGRPILGAIGPDGQAVLGLPGNPVSVMVTARRFGAAAVRKCAGLASADVPPVSIRVDCGLRAAPDLWWCQPVRLVSAETAEALDNRGSGDVAAVARSDGFVEVPPGSGPPSQNAYPFWQWVV